MPKNVKKKILEKMLRKSKMVKKSKHVKKILKFEESSKSHNIKNGERSKNVIKKIKSVKLCRKSREYFTMSLTAPSIIKFSKL